MNERIKELALQAGCKVMDDGDWYIPSAKGLEKIVYTKGIGLEKFAELIVRECIDICYNHPARMPSNNWQGVTVPLDIVHRLEEHFGVEE